MQLTMEIRIQVAEVRILDHEHDLLALRSILLELEKRGHRLRHPLVNEENETAGTLDLRGKQGSAVIETTEVRNESEPTSK
jgi:hypothetical protein